MSDNVTIAYRLFHEYFTVRIPAAFAYEKQNSVTGTIDYDSQSKQELAASEMSARQYTIPELAVFSSKGASIVIEHPKEQAPKMYALVRDYLNECNYRVTTTINNPTIPMSDLRKLDEFARVVYQVARQYEDIDTRGSKTDRGLRDLMSSRGFRRSSVDKEKSGEPKKLVAEPVREHRPITEEISHAVLENGLRYK